MQKSESITELAKALSKMQGELEPAKKDSVNPFFHSKYADLAAIYEVCRKPLADNGLAVTQLIHNTIESGITLETVLLHTSGEWLSSELAINPIKPEPQAIGSALTYARRYALSAILGIAADEDDDAEAAQGRKAEREKDKPSSQPPEEKGHYCKIHGVNYFKRGKMKAYGHPLKDENGKDTGEWCHEHTEKPTEIVAEEQVPDDALITEIQLQDLNVLLESAGLELDALKRYVTAKGWGITKRAALTQAQFREVCEAIHWGEVK